MNDYPPELRTLAESLPPELRLATESVVLARWQLSRQMGRGFQGARDYYGVLGYDEQISTEQYRDLYKRGGIAGACVDAIPKAVWRGDGELIEDQDVEVVTAFEQAWFDLNDRLKIWSTLQRAHILALLSSFSALLLGAPGDFTQELPRARGPQDLIYLQPFGGGVSNESRGTQSQTTTGSDVSVALWDESGSSPRFGQPLAYNLRRTNIVSPELSRPVHWTRVLHIPAEGFLDDAVFGPPALEGVWNYFQDLLKVIGGGSETSWLAGNPGLHMNLDKDMTWPGQSATEQAAAGQAIIDAMKAKADEYRHQLTRWLMTRGVEVTPLAGKAVDFSANADTLITLIAGTRGIPKRILVGSERGELASGQDRQNLADVVKDCRSSYAHPIILRPFIDRLIAYGYMPKPKQWMPAWPETGGMSETEKLAAAETMTKLNDHGERVVTGNEVREFLGKEPLDPKDMDDEDAQVAKLEAALRKGGTLSLAMKG